MRNKFGVVDVDD